MLQIWKGIRSTSFPWCVCREQGRVAHVTGTRQRLCVPAGHRSPCHLCCPPTPFLCKARWQQMFSTNGLRYPVGAVFSLLLLWWWASRSSQLRSIIYKLTVRKYTLYLHCLSYLKDSIIYKLFWFPICIFLANIFLRMKTNCHQRYYTEIQLINKQLTLWNVWYAPL